MSTPANPLASFRTYAYHFLLGVTDTSSRARAFLETPRFDQLPRTGRVTQRLVDDATGVAPLINSKTDSDYVIQDFKMFNLLTPKGGGSASDTHALFNAESSMVIKEPRGVDFLNNLREIHGQLGTDPSGSVFVLQIQFVGHNDAGPANNGSMSETVVETVGIQLKMANIEAKFDETGSEYNIQFVGMVNGVTRTPHVLQGLQRTQIPSDKALTLSEAIGALQKNANTLYNERYENVEKERTKQGVDPVKPGGRVQYLFDPGVFAPCIIDQHMPSQTNEGNHGEERGSFNWGKKKNADSLLVDLAYFCTEILKDKENDSESIYVPNVVSFELSGEDAKELAAQNGITNDVDYLMVYKLVRHKQAVTTNDLRLQAARRDIDPGNVIEFDYFFTGRNTDVLDFDLNMNMGLAYVSSITTTPNRGAQGTTGTEDPENQKTLDLTQTQDPRTACSPWYPDQPATIAKKRYTGSPEAQINARAQQAKAAGYEMLEATLTITGNPILLANLNPDALALFRGEPRLGQTKGPGGEDLDVNKDWSGRKGFIKVNLFTQDQGEDDSMSPQFMKSEFWYNGFYELIAVESDFSGGEFTQKLTVMSLPFDFPTDPDTSRRTRSEKMASDAADQENLSGDKHESVDAQPEE